MSAALFFRTIPTSNLSATPIIPEVMPQKARGKPNRMLMPVATRPRVERKSEGW